MEKIVDDEKLLRDVILSELDEYIEIREELCKILGGSDSDPLQIALQVSLVCNRTKYY